MGITLSTRLAEIADALPLYDGIRVLEIGCGPGALAREISQRIGRGYILGVDRSVKAIEKAISGSAKEIESGILSFKVVAIENFKPYTNGELFDIAIAVRVGALDGRHPELEKQALANIAKVLTTKGKLFIDGGNPIKEIFLDEYRKNATSASGLV